ncbi:TPM domain-containing protein [Leptolyngbya sp. AN02str]|uniref:TPM domain-containing protein n=1 Tax=Leptolyngbya sp. AN02str TaxID=3423363 RepID=UPI003D31E8A2
MMQDVHLICPGFVAWLRRSRFWWTFVATVLGLLLWGAVGQAQAQASYPPFLDPYLNDYAQIVEARDAANIRATLGQFRQDTGIQTVVVTVNSVQDYGTGDRTIESFATNLFNRWGIGDRTRNDGILLLVAPGDRRVRIELGSGYASSDNAVAQAIIDDRILPHFRDGRMSQGTRAGVEGIVARFHPTAVPSASADGLGLVDVVQSVRDDMPVTGQVVLLGSLLSLLAGGGLIGRSLWRHRHQTCPHCQTPMLRLDEQSDDQFLNEGQRKEESLSSVDYDVWQCPSCGHHKVHRYASLFSGYRQCPSCQVRALHVKRTTTRHPTYTYEGEERVDENCRHCSYQRTHYRSIPRRTRSSSGGSSGGGGRSSGGGASGSW